MQRIIRWIMCFALTIMTGVMVVGAETVDPDICEHYIVCDDETKTCVFCKTPNVTPVIISHDYVLAYDLYYHWKECSLCGERSWEGVESHEGTCAEPARCVECGATEIADSPTQHIDESVVMFNETTCWRQCIGCGEIMFEYGNHAASCVATEQCIYCDQIGVTIAEVYHRGNSEYRPKDATMCWRVCTACDLPLEDSQPERHSAECYSPNLCLRCDYSECEDAELSHWGGESVHAVAYDAEYHEQICVDCGEPLGEMFRHRVNCSYPTVTCWVCDYEGCETPDIIHDGAEELEKMSYDDTYHWYICDMCGEPTAPWNKGDIYIKHSAYCNSDDKNTCFYCGANGVKVEIEHPRLGDYGTMYDSMYHWYGCMECGGDKSDIEPHYAYCNAPEKCDECGAEDIECAIWHAYMVRDWDGEEYVIRYEGRTFSDESGHWWHCSDCEDETRHPHEYSDDNTCVVCDYEKVIEVPRFPGDADSSSAVNLDDAILILQYCTDTSVAINTSNADVTGDGAVNLYDALRILQYAAGWNVTLK